ncbi:chaplin [Streptomyces beihaiensis]|uniref:chaplin n=1 Tax=Streptomyces beihaiensis TaxID=2984495 RepID=UPI002B1CDC93|nr:chaplin [Streptomyces beihaiensis]
MRQVTRKGLITVAAATGVLAVTGGYAQADSGASGSSSNSPGVLSGNTVQAPVDVPVNVCGNTVNVIGLLNPAVGNDCSNASNGGAGNGGSGGGSNSGGGSSGGSHQGGGGSHQGGGGSHAGGGTSHSPGVGSGNTVQVPIGVPVNVCGNTVDVAALGNPATGDDCANAPGGGGTTTPPSSPPTTPPSSPPTTPPSSPPSSPPNGSNPGNPGHHAPGHPNRPGTQTVTQPVGESQLAQTGSDVPVGALIPLSAGALLAGALLYRRSRSAA